MVYEWAKTYLKEPVYEPLIQEALLASLWAKEGEEAFFAHLERERDPLVLEKIGDILSSPSFYYNSALLYLKEGKQEDIRRIFSKISDRKCYTRAFAYLAYLAQDWDWVIESLTYIEEEDMGNLLLLGEVYLLKRDYKNAEYVYQKLITDYPGCQIIPYINLALINLKGGQRSQALEVLKLGREFFAEEVEFMRYYAMVLASLGRDSQALSLLQPWLGKNDKVDLLVFSLLNKHKCQGCRTVALWQMWRAREQYDKELALLMLFEFSKSNLWYDFNLLAEQLPGSVDNDVYRFLAYRDYFFGDLDGAQEKFFKGVNPSTQNEALYNVGLLYYHRRDFHKALEYFTQAYEQIPFKKYKHKELCERECDYLARVCYYKGTCEYYLGLIDQAKLTLESSMDFCPSSASILGRVVVIALKNGEAIKALRESGFILGSLLKEIEKFAQVGTCLLELDRWAEDFILKNKAKPAFKGYNGFSGTLCLSVNEAVIHGPPRPYKLKATDILSIDCGVNLNSYYTDAALTVAMNQAPQEALQLIETTQQALYSGIKQVQVGGRIKDIGKVIFKKAQAKGYGVVYQYCGHGVGFSLHEEPNVPNLPEGSLKLREGLVIAIEPMFNLGKAEVEVLSDGWTVVTVDLLACLFLGGLFLGSLWTSSSKPQFTFAVVDKNTELEKASEYEKSPYPLQEAFREVSRSLLPSVIEIHGKGIARLGGLYSLFGFDFGGPREQEWAGSGVIVLKDEKNYYALTNNHVIENASALEVKVYGSDAYTKAEIKGTDARRDLALISFEKSAVNAKVAVAPLGDSNQLEVGDIVLAIGSPLEYSFTVTQGIISALLRSVNPRVASRNSFIQTDAAINQGNSGGPLVNLKGEVVGINTAIATPSGGNVGLGFAIPINDAKLAIERFLSNKKVDQGSAWLGVLSSLSLDVAMLESLKLDAKQKGAFLVSVVLGACAERAGLRAGDLIIAVNQQLIGSGADLSSYLSGFYTGEEVLVKYIRQGEQKELKLTLSARPDEKQQEKNRYFPSFTVYPLTDEVRDYFGLQKKTWVQGVIVTSFLSKKEASQSSLKNIEGVFMQKVFISPEELRDEAIKIAYQLYQDNFIPDVLYVLLRGGAYLGNVISEYFKIVLPSGHKEIFYGAVVARSYDNSCTQAKDIAIDGWTYEPKKLKKSDKILLVDDVYDTGRTINYLANILIENGVAHENCKIAVFDYKVRKESKDLPFKPSYFANKILADSNGKFAWRHYLTHELVGLDSKDINKLITQGKKDSKLLEAIQFFLNIQEKKKELT
ncbi:UNVERIFIED_CONTAM: hypothetical protein PYX00_011943 [Menopon gallinae]|uniref:Serine protease HTRA2, mitochondrial n=1 Tax=Menopon gallinae TaxID=328185 RepID=A0AAW2H8Y1_9NEOP